MTTVKCMILTGSKAGQTAVVVSTASKNNSLYEVTTLIDGKAVRFAATEVEFLNQELGIW